VEHAIAEIPGTADIVNPVKVRQTNLRLQIDTLKAAMRACHLADIDRAVRLSVAGLRSQIQRTNGAQTTFVRAALRLPLAPICTRSTKCGLRPRTVKCCL